MKPLSVYLLSVFGIAAPKRANRSQRYFFDAASRKVWKLDSLQTTQLLNHYSRTIKIWLTKLVPMSAYLPDPNIYCSVSGFFFKFELKFEFLIKEVIYIIAFAVKNKKYIPCSLTHEVTIYGRQQP